MSARGASPNSDERHPSVSRLLAWGTGFVVLGQSAAAPVLPEFVLRLDMSAIGVAWAISAFAVGRLLVNVPVGMLHGRVARRTLLLSGSLITSAGMFGSGLATSYVMLLGFRLLAGVGSGVYMTAAVLTLVEIAPLTARARLLGANQTALIAAASVGPAVGGLLGEVVGLRASFLVVGVLTAIGGSVVLFRVPPGDVRASQLAAGSSAAGPSSSGPSRHRLAAARRDILNAPYVVASIVNFIVFGTRMGSRQTLLPLIASIRFNMSVGLIGLLFSAMSIVSLIVLPLSSRIGDRMTRAQMIVPALTVSVAGLLLCAFAPTQTWLWIGSLVLAGGMSAVGPAPAAWVADSTPTARQGVALSSFRTVGDLGSLAGPVLLGGAAAIGTLGFAMGLNAAALVVVAVSVWLTGNRPGPAFDARGRPHPTDEVTDAPVKRKDA